MKSMSQENAFIEGRTDKDSLNDLESLEEVLREQLETQLGDLAFLKAETDRVGNSEKLGEVIKNVVWEQFINQIATTAGEDFIRDNQGLTLDLSKDAHIQTTENFVQGKMAQHNTEIGRAHV